MKPSPHQTFDLRIKRQRHRITQAAVAEALEVNHAVVSRFEMYGLPLPRGLTSDDYRVVLDRLIAEAEAVAQ